MRSCKRRQGPGRGTARLPRVTKGRSRVSLLATSTDGGVRWRRNRQGARDVRRLLQFARPRRSDAGGIRGGRQLLRRRHAGLSQQDMKKLIAYSSVGRKGFVTLGIFVLNIRGWKGPCCR